MTRRRIVAIVTIAVATVFFAAVLAAAFTCPDRKSHVESVKASIAMENSVDDGAVRVRGDAFRAVVDAALFVDDYVLFSVGGLNFEKRTYVVSVGLFGHVYVLTHFIVE